MLEVSSSSEEDDDGDDKVSGASVCKGVSSPEEAETGKGNLSWRWWVCREKLCGMG